MSMNRKNGLKALLLYIAAVFIFNWSILCGKNLMKWDIMDAYYPLCMMSADMLRSGKLPLWNAALQFGTPAHAMLGIPYWYPTTLLFEITMGYLLICVALEYCLHIVLACFGMFLLTKAHLDNTEKENAFAISFSAGLFYGFSGLFISNAQHIMIIVSATWLPYILLFVKRYFDTRSRVFLAAAALCMGMSILGGYPEVWVASFIVLIPYFVIHAASPDRRVHMRILKAALSYAVFSLEALASAAVSLVPFIMSSKYVSRIGERYLPNSYDLQMALSAVFPHYTELSGMLGGKIDVSMISMFMGFLTVILIFFACVLKIRHKWGYISIACFAFLMMLGDNAFLHTLFYKYFPMFSNLRFPTIWRCILAVFVLLLTAEAMEKIMADNKLMKVLAIACAAAGVLFAALRFLLPVITDTLPAKVLDGLRRDLRTGAFVFLAYVPLIVGMLLFKTGKRRWECAFAIMAFADVFAGQYCLYPLTVTALNQWDMEEMAAASEWMENTYEMDRNRTHSVEYKDAALAKSGFDSQSIVLNHTLDEDGYLSVKINYIQKYKTSAHCRVSSDMPVAYITNDVVDSGDVDYNEWVNDESVSPYQIYVEQKSGEAGEYGFLNEEIKAKSLISGRMLFDVGKAGYLVVRQSYYPGWKASVDGKPSDIVMVNGALLGVYLEPGSHKVEFVFRPLDFYAGAAVSAVFLAYFIFELSRHWKQRKERKA